MLRGPRTASGTTGARALLSTMVVPTALAVSLSGTILSPAGASGEAVTAAFGADPTTARTAALMPSGISAALPSGTAAPDQTKVITGTVTGPVVAGRTVLIQTGGANGTWVPLASTTTRIDGTFTAKAPTWWASRQILRAYVTPTPTEAAAASSTGILTVGRSYRPRGGTEYAVTVSSRRHPARWNPCKPITYRLYSRLAWRGAEADVRYALRQISAASGLRFVHTGSPRTYGPARRDDTDLKIMWSTPAQNPRLRGPVLGVGGSSVSATERYDGEVSLDATQRIHGSAAARHRLRLSLLLHEIGHSIGLDHVTDRRQMMYPVLRDMAPRYGSGDLRGLAALGAAGGCVGSNNR